MEKNDIIDNETLEWFGFYRRGNDDLEWEHRYLQPKNLWLMYFDQNYHFMMRDNSFQGIGAMKTIKELVSGFKFVTGYDLWELATTKQH